MGQYRLDEAGVTSVASSLVDDPDTLHSQALEVSRAVIGATCGVGGECPTLRHTLERLPLLGGGALLTDGAGLAPATPTSAEEREARRAEIGGNATAVLESLTPGNDDTTPRRSGS